MTFDWQFAVVTAIAIAAAAVIVRRFVPARRRSRTGRPDAPAAACEHCDAGAQQTRASGSGSAARTRTTPVVSVDDLKRSTRPR